MPGDGDSRERTLNPAAGLTAGLRAIVAADRVLTRPIDLVAYASDASVYRLTPLAVVRPQTVAEVQSLFRFSHAQQVPLVFRAAGTSLSGQAVTDGVLADLSHHWRAIEVLDGGLRVRVEPGAIGGTVNRALLPHRVRLGPDPASINACMLGGILSNNSSGMCCGVVQNAYHTLDSVTFVLPSGTVIDTARLDADQVLQEREPRVHRGLLAIRQAIVDRPGLRDRIAAKYQTKNTNGYSLNAFVDYERPVDILQHLLIGSEGTLAFIASAVLRTVPDLPVKYTGLLFFPGIREACAAIVPLRDAGAAALEIMDRSALGSVAGQRGMPPELATLAPGTAGLLVEFQTADEGERSALAERACMTLSGLAISGRPVFTHEPAEQTALWQVRQGMFPSVGSSRPRSTAVLIEDVAFPVERLADAVADLTNLFHTHGYADAIIFGHAKDGNLHFVLSQSFNTQRAIDQYSRFMDDVVALVTRRYDGALKAEHGTGRNMAPFVEAEWGHEAWALMQSVKQLIDPTGLLNPGVIINSDPRAHLANLKALPVVEEEVDKCIECGYCEPRCPSRDLTLTPRQRIVVRREIARLAAAGAAAGAMKALDRAFGYDGLDTCAVDGLCATACPVGIDTGQLTKRLRDTRHSWLAHALALQAVWHFAALERGVRAGLRLNHLAESAGANRVLASVSRGASRLLGGRLPRWLPPMPAPASGRLPATERSTAVAVYFPSCLSRTLGPLPGEPTDLTVAEALVEIARRAGRPLWIPEGVAGLCCGVPFASKGYARAHREMIARTVGRLFEWSEGGRHPVVTDTSPCAFGLRTCGASLEARDRAKLEQLTILDSIEFVRATLLPHLRIQRRVPAITLHRVCAVEKAGLGADLERLVASCSDDVFTPSSSGCCGFAGDLGWLVPELTASATALEAGEVRLHAAGGCYSSSRTCEIGMSRATGQVYRSYLFLLEWASRPVSFTASTNATMFSNGTSGST